MTTTVALAPAEVRVSPAELERAACVLAQDLRAHLLDGLAHGRLGAVVSVGRQAEHLVALLGPRLADAAFRAACSESVT